MKKILLTATVFAILASPAAAQALALTTYPSPGEIIGSATKSEWVSIAADDILVMELAPDAKGKARNIIIQLVAPPFSQGWVKNIRRLAAARWWDGTSINRVQDNYVVQWGDANAEEADAKPLPEELAVVQESEYVIDANSLVAGSFQNFAIARESNVVDKVAQMADEAKYAAEQTDVTNDNYIAREFVAPKVDGYSEFTGFSNGWPFASDFENIWPIHCYGAIGVGRSLSPDTGSGAELYTVIGHAPRHLDRNIAVVGRVMEGMEYLSSLPRGTGPLGFYETEEERVSIRSIRLASELPKDEQPRFEYLSTESKTFALYADARASRRDPFFITPAGGADICNIPVPIRRAAK